MSQTFTKGKTVIVAVPVLVFVAAVIIGTAVLVASAAKFFVASLNYPLTISVAAAALVVWAVFILKAVKADE
ncbi:MAG: hypothetical protein M3430_06600 [Acidobacteriota bacterium]|nr:hypothetical protein [Acidobacteriota bacterium]